MNPAPTSTWRLLGRIQAIPGYAYGCHYPALVIDFSGKGLDAGHGQAMLQACEAMCPGVAQDDLLVPVANHWRQSVEWLLRVWLVLQVRLGLPVYEGGRVLAIGPQQVRCVIPTLEAAHGAMAQVVLQTLAYLEQSFDPAVAQTEAQRLKLAIKDLGRYKASGSNVPRFVRAAFELGMPCCPLVGGVYQYGVGEKARWLDSSFTDVTPSIAAKLSRNKVLAASLLRQAGIPVPPHQLVSSAEACVQAAHQFGYPVVVKPADLDGGVGVAAGLVSDDEVRQAFGQARAHSSKVLLEKHVDGRDYRVNVFNGEVIWAVERVPAGVVGDGQKSVAELVEHTNADPRRGRGKHAALQRLVLDGEAQQLLARQGLEADAVPEVGRFVRLRRTANVASGGTPMVVFEQVHPDNARLAVRAAEALRLDIAGIDLLIPDIAVSWRETGAAICEVNGQPQLGQVTSAHLYPQILKQLVSGSGRVPTILVVGATQSENWLQAISSQLAAGGLKVGLVSNGKVSVDGEIVHEGAVSFFASGKTLALNRNVGAMVLAIEDDSILRTGLPVDRCDALILAGGNLNSRQERNRESHQRWMSELMRSLLPACDGVVVAPKIGGLKLQGFRELSTATWHEMEGAIPLVCAQTVEMVKALVKSRHADDRWGAA